MTRRQREDLRERLTAAVTEHSTGKAWEEIGEEAMTSFKLGDRVRIDNVSEVSRIPTALLGGVGTVLRLDLSHIDQRIQVRTDRDGYAWYIHPCDMTLVSARAPRARLRCPRCPRCDSLCNTVDAWRSMLGITYCSAYCHDLTHPSKPIAQLGPAPKPDPYTQHREHWAGEGAVMLKSWHENAPGNVAARKRLVAALAAELDRPAPVGFPPESRSCRIYRSNDR